MLTQCNFKQYSGGIMICPKKFFVTVKQGAFGNTIVTNMLITCDGEDKCMDFLTYKNTELLLARNNDKGN